MATATPLHLRPTRQQWGTRSASTRGGTRLGSSLTGTQPPRSGMMSQRESCTAILATKVRNTVRAYRFYLLHIFISFFPLLSVLFGCARGCGDGAPFLLAVPMYTRAHASTSGKCVGAARIIRRQRALLRGGYADVYVPLMTLTTLWRCGRTNR